MLLPAILRYAKKQGVCKVIADSALNVPAKVHKHNTELTYISAIRVWGDFGLNRSRLKCFQVQLVTYCHLWVSIYQFEVYPMNSLKMIHDLPIVLNLMNRSLLYLNRPSVTSGSISLVIECHHNFSTLGMQKCNVVRRLSCKDWVGGCPVLADEEFLLVGLENIHLGQPYSSQMNLRDHTSLQKDAI
jgi:hypothetical protein